MSRIAGIAALLVSTAAVCAADELFATQGDGEHLSPGEGAVRLLEHRVEADVDLAAGLARTRVRRVFRAEAAPDISPVWAVYRFPIPIRARVLAPADLTRFARGVCEFALDRMPDDTTFEFETRLEEDLEESEGVVAYRYPVVTQSGEGVPVACFHMVVRIRAAAPIRGVSAPGRPVAVAWRGPCEVELEWLAGGHPILEDPVVRIELAPPGDPGARSPHDETLILDASASMDGGKFQRARRELSARLAVLSPVDRFRILVFSDRLSWFGSSEFAPATPANLDAGLAWAESLEPARCSNLELALSEALEKGGGRQGRPHRVRLVSDGVPTVGECGSRALVRLVGARIDGWTTLTTHAVGGAADCDRDLLETLAAASRSDCPPHSGEEPTFSPPAHSTSNPALEWLAGHQNPRAGVWDGAYAERCRYGLCEGRGPADSTRATALAVVAFVAYGYDHRRGVYRRIVKRGLARLVGLVDPEGRFAAEGTEASLEVAAIATLALAEAYGLTQAREIRPPLERAVARLVSRMSGQPEVEALSLGWILMALKSAKVAGLAVPDSAFLELRDRIVTVCELPAPESAAVSILAHAWLGGDPGDATIGERGRFLIRELAEQGEGARADSVRDYFVTLSLFMLGGDCWKTWSGAANKAFAASACPDGCARGSWDPRGDSDRVEATALGALRLSIYRR